MNDLTVVDLQPFAAGDFESAIVQAQQVQNRGVQVCHVVSFAECVVAQFIGGTVNVAFFQTGPGHPDRKSVRMMIATVFATAAEFPTWSPSEFRAEHNQRIVE